jgi:hypothetical protein
MKAFSYLWILPVVLLSFAECRDAESLPIVPSIKYKSHQKITNANGKDSLIRLTFSYIDGDGDLGLSESDTLPPYKYGGKFYFNIFIDYYEKSGNKFVPVVIPFTTDTVRFLYRMDVITPEGKNKAIRGEISTIMDLSPYNVKPSAIKFGIQIADRQLHLSNKAESPEIKMNF